jgi:hypothetical protein
MNNDLIFRMSDALAERTKAEAGVHPRSQITYLTELAMGRSASEEDMQLGEPFIQEHGLNAYCRVLLNSNEFLFIQ